MKIKEPEEDMKIIADEWKVKIRTKGNEILILTMHQARELDEPRLAFMANILRLSELYPVWFWAAQQASFPLPDNVLRKCHFEDKG